MMVEASGPGKGPEGFPTACAAFLRSAQVADFDDDGEGGTGHGGRAPDCRAVVPAYAGWLM